MRLQVCAQLVCPHLYFLLMFIIHLDWCCFHQVLGDMPQKTFEFTKTREPAESLSIAPAVTVHEALKRVLRLPSVCSKRFLTTKVVR